MAYIGNRSDTAFTSLEKQDFSNPSGTTLTLTHAVANANDIALYINNVRQEPTEAYSVNGTTVTLTGSVSNSDDIYVIYLARAVQTTVPPDGSVSTTKIANSAVDLTSKVTGILPTTNGGVGFTSTTRPFFHVEAFTATTSNASQTGVLNFNGIVTNQGSHWNSSNNRFEAPITGIYQFSFNGFGTRNSSGSVLNSSADAQVVLQKSTDSGSNYTTAAIGGYAFFNSGNGYINMSFTIALALNSGDYIRFNAIKAYVFVQDKASNYFASASGHLIG